VSHAFALRDAVMEKVEKTVIREVEQAPPNPIAKLISFGYR